jgi:hypothetical protein
MHPVGRADDRGVQGVTSMQQFENACPHDMTTRAGKCSSCCDSTNSLTPCVLAWLREQPGMPVRVVKPVAMFLPLAERTAA